MTRKPIPRLYHLKPSQVRAMMRDLQYVLYDYRIVIAVDTHELVNYCFPIDPTQKQPVRIDPEELAESQVALSHLFRPGEPERPPIVLLPEYQKERKRILNAIGDQARDVYRAAELIQKMVVAGHLDDAATENREQLDAVVQRSFQFLLTVLLGIHSIGVKRMIEVSDNVLTPLENSVAPEDRRAFGDMIRSYRKEHYATILDILEEENKHRDADLTRKNQCDALEIDRLIYLNTKAEQAYQASVFQKPYLFIYVSSARKSERLFRHPKIRAIMPRLKGLKTDLTKGRRYSFLRNRHQILAYAIYRSLSSDNPVERVKQTFKQLADVRLLLIRVQKLEKLRMPAIECQECVFDGHQPKSCPLANQCLEVMTTVEIIRKKRQELINLGLVSHIAEYSNLLEAQIPELGYEVYIQLFKEILEKTNRNLALERMHERLVWINRASDWALARHPAADNYVVEIGDMKSEQDAIRGIDQYLPIYPRFQSTEYKEIIDLLIRFFKNPKQAKLVEESYDRFHTLGSRLTQADPEYDLLSCYFYLSFGFEGQSVHAYIKDKLLSKRDGQANKNIWREALYILCWSARRFGLFAEAEGYATEGIRLFPGDGRFPHGRAITIYAWNDQGENCPFSLADAIADSEAGLNCYLAQSESRDQLAASHNNIAYLLACEIKEKPQLDLSELLTRLKMAREHLDALKAVVNKNNWNPGHPEFFHTEAFLEFQEVSRMWRTNEIPDEILVGRLRSAKRDLQKAIDICERPRYLELKAQIEEFYERRIARRQ